MIQDFKLIDAHLHIFDKRFSLVVNNGYLPETRSCEDYLHRMEKYRLCGGAVVSGSFQAMDQSYSLDALKLPGPSFVGVTQLPATVSDQQLLELDKAGVRVKATGFGRVDFDVRAALRDLCSANP